MRNFSIDLVWAKVQTAAAAIGGYLGYFVGGVDGLMTALIIFMVIDYITGLMCAIANKKLSSEVGFKRASVGRCSSSCWSVSRTSSICMWSARGRRCAAQSCLSFLFAFLGPALQNAGSWNCRTETGVPDRAEHPIRMIKNRIKHPGIWAIRPRGGTNQHE